MSTYFILLFCGLTLIGLEIFVPGGVLGILGAAALIATAVLGFNTEVFPPWFGWVSLMMIFFLTCLAIYAWIRFLPNSPIGRALSLPGKTNDKKDEEPSPWQPGLKGTTLCELRPSGKALINNKRADVIADNGSFIDNETAIEIVKVSGNRIYVKEVNAES